jgi:hypothetical protein
MGSGKLAAAAAALVVLALVPASHAHEESALYALTVLNRVTPAVVGVDIRIVHLDSPALVITNDSAEVLTVLGEENEPFLRISSRGVYANVESPTTYRSSVPRRTIAPADVDPRAKPEWSRFSEEPTWTWFDPRLRFEDGKESWKVLLKFEDRDVMIEGGYESLQGHGHFITSIETPDIEGLDLRLTQGAIPAMFVRNDTGETLEVNGDAGEPFLQVRSDGVRANLRSPTYYTSGSTAILKVPTTADAAAPPKWSEVSNVPVWAWLERKAAVPTELYQRAALGDERRTILEWTNEYVLGGEPLSIAGNVEWIPPGGGVSSPAPDDDAPPWFLIAGVAIAGAAAAATLLRRRPASPA